MSTFVETFKEDMEDAGYRIVANKLTQTIHLALVKFIESKGAKRKEIKTFNKWLGSKYGQAFIGIVLGLVIEHVDIEIFKDERIRRLAEEMRNNGYTLLFNELLSEIIGKAMEAFNNAAAQLPERKVRIEDIQNTVVEQPAAAAPAQAAKPVIR